MGLSSFKTRWQLMLEKAGLEENPFTGNRYTLYGQKMEPFIREYVNSRYNTRFEPNRVILENEGVRCHSDGFNGLAILEIKTTSQIFDTADEYKHYLVQLLKYMEANEVDGGILAVYHRPDDFSLEFDPDRLQIFEISIHDYVSLLKTINYEIERFRADLERLKNNPLLSEEDFQPNELVTLSNQVLAFEKQLVQYKDLEQRYCEVKKKLYEAMKNHDVKSWTTPNNTKITRVDGAEGTTETVIQFDEKQFKAENPGIYEQYCKQTTKKKNGRAGYVKITLPKP